MKSVSSAVCLLGNHQRERGEAAERTRGREGTEQNEWVKK